jgi:hypothetical protein
MLGEALLVAPFTDASRRRTITLPDGALWFDWWVEDALPITGGTTVTSSFADDLSRIPVFVRQGAIIPAEVSSALTGLGDSSSRGLSTVLVYPGAQSTFIVHDEDGATTTIAVAPSPEDSGVLVQFSRRLRATVLRVRADSAPLEVLDNDGSLDRAMDRSTFDDASQAAWYDGQRHYLWVKLNAMHGTSTVEVRLHP